MFTFLPKPIYHFITDHRLGGPLAILIGLACVWLFIQAVYLLRFLSKRIKLLHAIHIGKNHIHIANSFWFFGVHRDKVDFYLQSDESIFAVKVMGAFRPGMEFCFVNKHEYHKQRHIVAGSQLLIVACGYGKRKTLPDIDFTYQCEAFGIEKDKITPVLLWCPAPYRITAKHEIPDKDRHSRSVDYAARFGYGVSYHTGDMLFDKLVMDAATLRSFCKRLSAK